MVLVGFSDGSINLTSSHNSSGILLTVGNTYSVVGHTYEQDSLKLYVYLFLGWVLVVRDIGPGIHYLQEDNPEGIGKCILDWSTKIT